MGRFEKVIIFYFSGTGNAKMIASWFSKFALESNVDCCIIDIAEKNRIELNEVDKKTLLVFISPIHGFNYPKITLDYIRNFPKGNHQVVLMNTRAGIKIGHFILPGLTGVAFFVSSFFLKGKGYHIIGQFSFDMPSNWISLHPAFRRKSIEFIYKKNYLRVRKSFENTYSGNVKFTFDKGIIQAILLSPIALAYYIIGRYFLAKSYYASYQCINCNLCVKQCPVQAIQAINTRPYWTLKCESCMRCMNSCPKKAIETTHGLWLIAILLTLVFYTFICQNILVHIMQYMIMRFFLFNLILLVITLILYRLQHWTLKSNIAAKLISLTSLTKYKFWGRYKADKTLDI